MGFSERMGHWKWGARNGIWVWFLGLLLCFGCANHEHAQATQKRLFQKEPWLNAIGESKGSIRLAMADDVCKRVKKGETLLNVLETLGAPDSLCDQTRPQGAAGAFLSKRTSIVLEYDLFADSENWLYGLFISFDKDGRVISIDRLP